MLKQTKIKFEYIKARKEKERNEAADSATRQTEGTKDIGIL